MQVRSSPTQILIVLINVATRNAPPLCGEKAHRAASEQVFAAVIDAEECGLRADKGIRMYMVNIYIARVDPD